MATYVEVAEEDLAKFIQLYSDTDVDRAIRALIKTDINHLSAKESRSISTLAFGLEARKKNLLESAPPVTHQIQSLSQTPHVSTIRMEIASEDMMQLQIGLRPIQMKYEGVVYEFGRMAGVSLRTGLPELIVVSVLMPFFQTQIHPYGNERELAAKMQQLPDFIQHRQSGDMAGCVLDVVRFLTTYNPQHLATFKHGKKRQELSVTDWPRADQVQVVSL